MELSQDILEYRARHNMTQIQFAKAIGMSPTTIRKIEAGGKVRPYTAAKIRVRMEEHDARAKD